MSKSWWTFFAQDQHTNQIASFTLIVFHLFCDRAYASAIYTVSLARGHELWGDDHSMAPIEHAWQQAGGVYSQYPQDNKGKGLKRIKSLKNDICVSIQTLCGTKTSASASSKNLTGD